MSFDPDWTVPPGWILEEWLDWHGVSVEEFSVAAEIPVATVRAVLVGEQVLDAVLIASTARVTGINTRFWGACERLYRDALAAGKKVAAPDVADPTTRTGQR